MERIALYNDSFQNEIWKPITGYENDYEASNMGRIRSVTKTFECFSKRGNHMQIRTRYGRIIKPHKQNNGYDVVWLSKNGKVKALTVHRLVAQTFLDNKNNLYCVNHKNGNKSDNRLENLGRKAYGFELKKEYVRAFYEKILPCKREDMFIMQEREEKRYKQQLLFVS